MMRGTVSAQVIPYVVRYSYVEKEITVGLLGNIQTCLSIGLMLFPTISFHREVKSVYYMPSSVTRKNHQMSIKVAQKRFH